MYQGLHYLLKQKQSSTREIQIYLGEPAIYIYIYIYTIDHPKFILSNQKEGLSIST